MIDKLVLSLARYMVFGGTKFLFGIGMGPSGQEEANYGTESGAGMFGVSQGEKDVLKGSDFWSSILSGDMGKISKVLGPELSAVNKKAQQRKKTTALFGNRGGGNNAVMNSIDDSTTSSIHDMISKLTGSAATNLTNTGTSLFGSGISATSDAFDEAKTMHDQNQAKWQDIFNSIGTIAGGAASFFPGGSLGSKIFTGIEGTLGS